MSFPCPVPLCRHHTLEPFPMEALLKSHIDASEHAFIDVWQSGPSPLQIDDIGTDTITMFWQPVPGASHYELQAKEISNNESSSTIPSSTSSTPTTSTTASSSAWKTLSSTLTSTIVKKKKLKPSTTYIFRYRAIDRVYTGGCESPYSSPSDSVTTLSATTVRPTPPTVMKSDSTSITIQWNTIEHATSYDVHFRICSTPPFTWDHAATITGCAVKKKGLQANTKYEFRVRSSSSTSASESSSSDSIHSIWSVPSLPVATLADFNPFKQLLGTTLINSKNKSVSIDLLTGKKLIMLYFSASWCPPCRQFTPMLAKFYNEMKSKGRSLEIIFVSADRDITSFTEYMTNEHPWQAIPYISPSRTTTSSYFQVNGIPRLIVFNGKTGGIVCSNAVQSPLTESSLDTWEKM